MRQINAFVLNFDASPMDAPNISACALDSLVEVNKLDPTLRMDVMSLCISCWAGLKRVSCYNHMGKYASDYKTKRG